MKRDLYLKIPGCICNIGDKVDILGKPIISISSYSKFQEA